MRFSQVRKLNYQLYYCILLVNTFHIIVIVNFLSCVVRGWVNHIQNYYYQNCTASLFILYTVQKKCMSELTCWAQSPPPPAKITVTRLTWLDSLDKQMDFPHRKYGNYTDSIQRFGGPVSSRYSIFTVNKDKLSIEAK